MFTTTRKCSVITIICVAKQHIKRDVGAVPKINMNSAGFFRYTLATPTDKAILRDSPEERYSWKVWVVNNVNDLSEAIYSYLPSGAELVTWNYEASTGLYEVLFRFKEKVTPRGVYILVESQEKKVVSIEGVTARTVLEAWTHNGCNFVIEQ